MTNETHDQCITTQTTQMTKEYFRFVGSWNKFAVSTSFLWPQPRTFPSRWLKLSQVGKSLLLRRTEQSVMGHPSNLWLTLNMPQWCLTYRENKRHNQFFIDSLLRWGSRCTHICILYFEYTSQWRKDMHIIPPCFLCTYQWASRAQSVQVTCLLMGTGSLKAERERLPL